MRRMRWSGRTCEPGSSTQGHRGSLIPTGKCLTPTAPSPPAKPQGPVPPAPRASGFGVSPTLMVAVLQRGGRGDFPPGAALGGAEGAAGAWGQAAAPPAMPEPAPLPSGPFPTAGRLLPAPRGEQGKASGGVDRAGGAKKDAGVEVVLL